eukprot:6206267-Pleurochrysis_carterae.AAC.2
MIMYGLGAARSGEIARQPTAICAAVSSDWQKIYQGLPCGPEGAQHAGSLRPQAWRPSKQQLQH